MSQSGGQTTQSGIYYQNSIAALYLGRLCDVTSRPADQQISHVRVESPNHVDDIVVTFANGHREYIQSKESVASGDAAWKTTWQDFDRQYRDEKFQRGKDHLLFQIGNITTKHDNLRELCERARAKENYDEWQAALTISQKSLLQKIKLLLSPELSGNTSLLEFIKSIEVVITPSQHIERDEAPRWMPPCNTQPIVLFRLLRDRVGGQARIGGSFMAHSLRESLKLDFSQLRQEKQPSSDKIELPTHLIWRTACFPCRLKS